MLTRQEADRILARLVDVKVDARNCIETLKEIKEGTSLFEGHAGRIIDEMSTYQFDEIIRRNAELFNREIKEKCHD